MTKHAVLRFLYLVMGCTLLSPVAGLGDLTVVREVVITPRSVNASANIGSVNSSPNIRLDTANIDIQVGAPDVSGKSKDSWSPIFLVVRGNFALVNQSTEELQLTVGFPVSNSEYSAYDLATFRVLTDGAIREVFSRVSGYPRRIRHEYISGELGPDESRPPAEIDRETVHLFGKQLMGKDSFQNLMVWQETFAPKQHKNVEVMYEITIPLQNTDVVREKVTGNHKGIWPQEANTIPVDFLSELDSGAYYFFDYYLTSGASWAGPISFEDISLKFDSWWQDLEFHSTIKQGRISWSNTTLYPGIPTVAYYSLRDVEPTENVYFAIRPGKNNKPRALHPDHDYVVPEGDRQATEGLLKE